MAAPPLCDCREELWCGGGGVGSGGSSRGEVGPEERVVDVSASIEFTTMCVDLLVTWSAGVGKKEDEGITSSAESQSAASHPPSKER